MRDTVTPGAPVAAETQERAALEQVARLVEDNGHPARLVGAESEGVELPASLAALVAEAVEHLRRGEAVAVVPYQRELTTQQAADLLNVSRPYLIRLLDEGCPYRRLGTHRRLALRDVLAYKERRDVDRHTALDELAAVSQEAGMYGAR